MNDAVNHTDEYVPRRSTLPSNEIVRLGKDIYERDIRRKAELDHVGKIVAIDVDSGCWALGDGILEAVDRLRAQRPQAVNVYSERAGYVAVGSIGGGFPRRTASSMVQSDVEAQTEARQEVRMKDAKTTKNAADNCVPRRPRRHHRETGRLGNEIYERDIRHKVEPDQIGKFLAIDVDSACWALGDTTREARNKLEDLRPKAIDVLMKRVGYVAVGSIGGGAPRRTA